MLLSGIAVTGGILALGAKVYKTRKPKRRLADALQSALINNSVTKNYRGSFPNSLAVGALTAGGALVMVTTIHGLTPLMLATRLVVFLHTSHYGPLLYILADTVRPITFFPNTLITIASGLLFGPVRGTVYSLVGAATSATTAYTLGKHLRREAGPNSPKLGPAISRARRSKLYLPFLGQRKEPLKRLEQYSQRMREHPFESMLTMHGLFLHFDFVNYLAGYSNLAWKPFIVGTTLGALPGTVASVLFGASLQGTTIRGMPRLNLVTLAASGIMIVGSLGFAYILRKREEI